MTSSTFDPLINELNIATRKEIVFIEDNVADIDTLIKGIGSGKEIVILDSTQDGLHQIAQALEGRSGIDAVHIMSHGSAGAVSLGSLMLDAGNLDACKDDLQSIGRSMSADGDILLYGCNIGAGEGAGFVHQLAIATGADVAASNDTTGAAAFGGDWDLEVVSGEIGAAPAIDAHAAALYQNVLNISPGTIEFGINGNFTSGLDPADPVGRDTNVAYRVNGNAAYLLNIDGQDAAISSYSDPASEIFAGVYVPESEITISFAAGQAFTPQSIGLSNWSSDAPDQTLQIKGFDSHDNQIGTTVTVSLHTTDYTATNVSLAALGGQLVKTLKITSTTSGNQIHYLMIDSLTIGTVAPYPPMVTFVSSSNLNGTYKIGDAIDVKVNFDNAVDVTGTPQLTLETGTTDRTINYVSGSGTSELTFRYIVQAGDASADLDYKNTAISLNGGTIKAYMSTSDAVVTLPTPGTAGSLASNKAIAIDGIVPTMAITSDRTVLKAGDTAAITFTFSEDPGASFVNGDIAVSGGTLSAISGTGITRTATFTPTANTNGGSASIAVGIGRYSDAAGNNNTGASNGPAITYDTLRPTVTISSDSSVLKAGDTAHITFSFNEDPGSSFSWNGSTGDVSVSGGTLSAIAGTGTTRTATFTPTANTNSGTASVSVNAGTFSDAAGNVNTAAGATPPISFDTLAPTVTITSDKSVLKIGDTAVITFSFSEDPGSSFSWDGSAGDVAVSGGTLSAMSGSGLTRTAIFTPGANVDAGTASITVAGSYQDAAGNLGAAGASPAISYDTLAPNAPSAPDLASADDSGTSNVDNLTNDPTTSFSGTADNGATVKLYDGALEIGSATASGGSWTIPVSNLAEGSHTLTAKSLDAAGNASAASGALNLVVDRTPPATTVSSAHLSNDTGASNTDMVTSASGTQLISGTLSANLAAGEQVMVSTNNGATWTDASTSVGTNTWELVTSLGASSVLQVRVVDQAGNAGATYAQAYVIDTAAPAAPSTPDLDNGSDSGSSQTDDITGITTPTFKGTAETGATVTLYAGATAIGSAVAAGGSWTIQSAELSAGTHDITAVAVDLAGNASPASPPLKVTVLTAPPTTAVAGMALSVDAGAPGDFVTNEIVQTITGTLSSVLAAGEHVQVSGDGGATWNAATSATGSDAWSILTALSLGTHDIRVRVIDAIDHTGPVHIQSYTLDIGKPAVGISPSALQLKAGETAAITFTFSEDPGASFDNADLVVSGGTLSAIQGTGLVRTAVFTPAADTNGGTASIGVMAGSYEDLAGNPGTAGASVPIGFDTLAPGAPSTPDLDRNSDKGASDSDNLTNIANPVFTGTAEAGATVRLYDSNGTTEIGSATATGGNWTITSSTLGEGSHTVTARATDAAGNVGAASGSITVTIDTAKPTVNISSDASQLKIGETALITFTFSEDPGASFSWDGAAGDVSVSGGTLSAISGSGLTRTAVFTPAANTNGGTGGISVGAGSYLDAAGNGGAAGAAPSLHFDTQAPAAPSTPVLLFDNGLSNHDGVINVPAPVFTGTAEAFSTVTLYDADTGEVLGSAPAGTGTWTILSKPLTEGAHSVYAVARDAAGNAGPASAGGMVVVDQTHPSVTVSSSAGTLNIGATALITFSFSEDPGAGFGIANLSSSAGTFSSLTGTGLTRTAVFTPNAGQEGHLVNLGSGSFTDMAGNSGMAGSVPLFIDTKAPLAPDTPKLAPGSDTGSSSTDGLTNVATPTFRGLKEFSATVTLYDSDGTVLGTSSENSTGWTITSLALSEGTHTITARQTDSAGNVGTLSAGLNVTVDTRVAAPAMPVLDPASDSATAGDALTSDTTPTITGSAEAGAGVTLLDSDGSTVLGTASADAAGAWSITSSALSAGSHALSARQVDAAGNASGAGPALVLHIDDVAAALAAPTLAPASDSGAAGDAITKVAAPIFSGTAEALAQVTLYDGAIAIGSVKAGADGAWQITAAALADGEHAITARQVDLAGNASAAGAVFKLAVDTVAPAAPSVPVLKAASDTGIPGDGVTVNSTPVIEGTALANALVTLYDGSGAGQVKLGTAIADSAGKWSIATSLSLGTHSLSATQSDAAGNVSSASTALAIRIEAPSSPSTLIDGMPVSIQPISLPGGVNGSAVSIPLVSTGRLESSGQAGVADIPLATSAQGSDLLVAQLGVGYGLSASGASVPVANAGELLLAAIRAATPTHAASDQGHLTGNGQAFLAGLASGGSLLVETVKPVSSAAPEGVLTLSGPAAGAGQATALVIDTGSLASGSTIALQQVDFAAVIGAANVVANLAARSGMVLSGDAASQHFTVAAGGSGSVFAGGGSDILSVAARAPAAPAAGLTLLHGGSANDIATFDGARADYNLEFHNGYVIVSSKSAPEAKAMVVNVEQLQFSDTSVAVRSSADMELLAGMYQTVLGRQADVMGIAYWADAHQAGVSWGAIALGMIGGGEHTAGHEAFNGLAAHDLALLYTAIFNRDADAAGLAYWSAAMARGLTLEQVASNFVQSAEMVGHQRAAADWDFIMG